LGHLQPAISDCIDRLLCKVYRPVDDVSAETSALSGCSCGHQSFIQLPGELPETANSGHRDSTAIFYRALISKPGADSRALRSD
jgi:hypothetical protein